MTEHKLSFTVPGEPVPAPRPRTVTKGGKTWTYAGNPAYRAWLKAIKKSCPEKHGFDAVSLKVLFATEKKQDVDNLVKGVMDALTDVLWENDKVVWNLSVVRLDGLKNAPHTYIEVIGEEPEHIQSTLCEGKSLSEMIA